MDMNIIKEYLVSLGFHIDEDSINNAKQSMAGIEGTIKGFANSNTESMSTMQDFFKMFNSSMKDNLGIVSKILPDTKLPILQLVSFVELLYRGISKVTKKLNDVKSDKFEQNAKNTKQASQSMQKFKEKAKEAQSPIIGLIALIKSLTASVDKLADKLNNINIPDTPKNTQEPSSNKTSLQLPSKPSKEIENVSSSMNKLTKGTGNAEKALSEFSSGGGEAIAGFAESAGISLGAVAAGAAALVVAVIGAWKTMTSVAKQDLGFQKLAMQLWTTTENAKEVSMALKTMKVSMQDLWLSPELLQQFNQLRKDSAELKLPSDAEDSFKLVRSVLFEFQRLKQAGSLAFQWIGYYITKYASGPLADAHEALQKFTDWVLQHIPEVAKVIGAILGTILRLIMTVGEVIGFVIKPIINIISSISDNLGGIPKPLQNILKLIGLIGIALMTGPIGAIFLLIMALDDLFTYLRGGKSVIGSFFDKFAIGAKIIDNVKTKFKSIKGWMLTPITEIKKGWDAFWGGILGFIDKVEDKFVKFEKAIKNSPIGKLLAKFIPDASEKTKSLAQNSKKNSGSSVANYITPHTTNNNKTSNSNITKSASQTNNFYVTGGSNANTTASTIADKLGLKSRTLGGIIS